MMEFNKFSILPDVVVAMRTTSGQLRYIAMTGARKVGADLVGDHFGDKFAVPLAEILSSVSIPTGAEYQWDQN